MRSPWILHHVVAMCQEPGCGWSSEHHGPGEHEPVLRAAREHAKAKGHYVQVERGQHAHYGPA